MIVGQHAATLWRGVERDPGGSTNCFMSCHARDQITPEPEKHQRPFGLAKAVTNIVDPRRIAERTSVEHRAPGKTPIDFVFLDLA